MRGFNIKNLVLILRHRSIVGYYNSRNPSSVDDSGRHGNNTDHGFYSCVCRSPSTWRNNSLDKVYMTRTNVYCTGTHETITRSEWVLMRVLGFISWKIYKISQAAKGLVSSPITLPVRAEPMDTELLTMTCCSA